MHDGIPTCIAFEDSIVCRPEDDLLIRSKHVAFHVIKIESSNAMHIGIPTCLAFEDSIVCRPEDDLLIRSKHVAFRVTKIESDFNET
jgi:hypothetical protein